MAEVRDAELSWKKGAEMLDKDPTLQSLLSMSLLEPTQPMI